MKISNLRILQETNVAKIMESSKYISLLTEKEIQKIFVGLEKNIDIREVENKQRESHRNNKNKRQEKEKGQKNVSEKRGNKYKQKFRYLEAVIDKIVNRKSCSYFKECLLNTKNGV